MILHNPIVSGSLTLSSNATFTANNGSVSGSEQIISLLPSGVVSGSSQVSLNGFDTDTLSEGSSNLYYTDTRVKTKLNADGVISGSSQLATTFLEINGDSVFSSSIQVNADTITNFDTNVKAKLNAETVISGSSQVTITESQISDLDKYNDSDFDTRLATKTTANLTEGSNLYYTVDRAKLKMNQDGVISGSSQLTTTFDTRYLNTEGDSVISGSSQISLSGFDTSDLSEDSSNLYYTDTRVKAKLNTDGVISGSTFSSPSQGTVRATINGANTDVDTGLQTGDNVQFANLTLTGNLSVQGNTTTIDSSVVNIGDNILELNYGGSQTTSGIYVTDGTGVSQTSGSFVWDATDGKDYWKAGKLGSESEVLTTSNLVSKLPSGTISGSSQVTVTESQISDLDKYTDSDVKTKLNTETVISGSSQVVLNDAIKTGFDTADVSEHSSKLYYTDARVKTKLNAEGAFSSSAQLGINNNTITFTAGDGLSGGGTITLNQSSDESVSFKVGDGIVSGSDQIASTFAQTILDDTSAGAVRTTIGVDAAGTDNSTDVTLGNTNYLTISGQAITGGTIPLSSGGTGATSAENARTALGVDAAGTDNSTDVTLSSTLDYISISGQEISIGQVDYSTDISNTPTTITPTQAGNITTNNNKVGYTDALVKTKLNAETVISGSGQVNADSIINFDSNVKAKINTENVVSGSTQIITLVGVDEDDMSSNSATKFPSQQSVKAYVDAQVDTKDALSELSGDTDDVSEGSSNLYYTDARVKTKLNAETVISGSSQVDVASTTNYSSINQYSDAKVKTKLNAETVISGSSQITITESQISDLSHYTDANVITVLNDNTVISGSSQITNGSTLLSGSNSISIDGTPVSLGGSVTTLQLGTSSETALAGNTRTISSGEITSISTNSSKVGYTDARVKTKLDADAVSSGSASEIKSFLGISSSDISDVAAFSQSGTYANLRAQGTTKGDVGLGNVTNESKATMFAGAALTSDPTAPTQGGTDDSTKIATTAFVQDRVDTIIGNAGSTLDTLGELSASLAEDSGSLASLVTTVGTKLSKGSNLSDLANTGTARTNLGVDAAGTDNSTDVTLVTTSHDYLSISGQAVTLGQVDYSSDISNLPTLVVVGTGAGDALAGNTRTISSTEISNISDNNDKVTNVSTNLSITGTTAARTIVSSDGTNAVIPIATTSVSGLLSPSLFDEIDANTAKVSDINHNVTTNLSITGTSGARTIVSSDGTDAIIPIATTSVSGLLSPGLFDEIDVNTAKVGYTDALVKLKLDADTVISGSAQILDLVSIDEDNFSSNSNTKVPTQQSVKAYVDSKAQSQDNTDELTEGSTNLFYTDARVKLKLDADTVISGSSQVNYNSIQNQPTIPSAASNATITLTAGTDLGTGGNFTTNQSSNETITINHSDISRTDTTSTSSPSYGGTFTAIDSVTTSARGHVTALNVKTVTLPSTDDTSYDLNVQAGASNTSIIRLAGSDSTNDDVTLSGGTGITISESGNVITITGTAQYGDSDVLTVLNDNAVFSGSLAASDISDFDTEVGNNSAVAANTAKVSDINHNVSTNLSEGTSTATTVDVNSSDGSNATLVSASTTRAGLLTKAKFDEIVANTLKVSDINHNVSTDLSITGTTGARTIVSSDGNNAVIPLATTSVSGLLSPGLFDEIDANTAKVSDINHNVSTDLSEGTSTETTVDVNSSDGNNATLASASTTRAGLLSAGKFDEITANTLKVSDINHNVSTDLSITGTTGARTIVSSDGNNAVIPLATTSVSGLLSPSLFDEIDANTAKVSDINHNVSTNLSKTVSGTGFSINSSDGNNVALTLADTDNWGIMSDEMFDKLDGIEASAQQNRTDSEIQSSIGTGNEKFVPSTGTDGHFLKHDGTFGLPSYTTNTNLSTEAVQDIVGGMFSSNTETRISATYVDGAEGAGKINLVVNDMTANDNDDVSIANLKTRLAGGFGSNAVSIGDSTDTVTIPGDLVVTGTTTTNNVEVVSTTNGVVFEGSAADANEGTLLAGTLSADRTYTLPNKTGTVAMTSDITGTNSGTNTGDETKSSINALDITEVGTISSGVWNGSAISTTYLSGQSGTNTGDETLSSINGLGITTLGTIGTGVWQGSAISTTYLSGQSGTNTGDETKSSINALDITEVGTISSGVWQGSAISATYLSGQSGTNTGDETKTSINALDITEVGTIDSGVWNGTAIADAYLSSNTAHLSGTQTFTGEKSFSNILTVTNSTATNATDTGALVVTGGVGIGGALNVGGDVVAYASSDERLKDNIELISNPIEKVQSLKGVTWDWNDNADELQQSLPNVGVIAQDVEKVLPELVTDRDNGYKGVDYAKLTGLLIEAIKEQQKEINDLKSKIK
jgi:trimeric autotransporter adhesin